MISLLGNTTNPYIIMAVFFIIPFLLTQVMSNLATVTIFIPLVAAACVKIGVDPRAAVMGVLMILLQYPLGELALWAMNGSQMTRD